MSTVAAVPPDGAGKHTGNQCTVGLSGREREHGCERKIAGSISTDPKYGWRYAKGIRVREVRGQLVFHVQVQPLPSVRIACNSCTTSVPQGGDSTHLVFVSSASGVNILSKA